MWQQSKSTRSRHQRRSWRLTRGIYLALLLVYAFLPSAQARPVADAEPWRLVQKGSGPGVNSLAFSPDGKLLAMGSADRTVTLWDVTEGHLVRTLAGHSAGVNSVAFDPNGKLLASGSADKTVKLWDIKTGKLLRTLAGHSDSVTSVAFSPDGKMLASGSADKTVQLWDLAVSEPIRTFKGHGDKVSSVMFFEPATGNLGLVSASHDKTVKLWDVKTGKLLRTLAGHVGHVNMVACCGRLMGELLASGSGDMTVRLWWGLLWEDGKSFDKIQPGYGINALTFSPSGRLVAAGGSSGMVKLWAIPTLHLAAAFRNGFSGVTSLAFHPEGRLMATAASDGSVKLWDVITLLRQHPYLPSRVDAVVFSPDGKLLATETDDTDVKLWDIATGKLVRTFLGRSVTFSPDGQLLATVNGDAAVKLWDVASGKLLHSLQGKAPLAFTADGKRLVAACNKQWDVATGKPLAARRGGAAAVDASVFSPDCHWAAGSGSKEHEVVLLQVATGKAGAQIRTNSSSLVFSPDGSLLAAAGDEEGAVLRKDVLTLSVRLWQVKTGKALRPLVRSIVIANLYYLTGEGYEVAAFSPDGKLLVAGGCGKSLSPPAGFCDAGLASLWDVRTGRLLRDFPSHIEVRAVAFSPNGKLVATAGCTLAFGEASSCDEGKVELWDIATGKLLRTLP